jgi:hypothetical protein
LFPEHTAILSGNTDRVPTLLGNTGIIDYSTSHGTMTLHRV